tara:strand:- start:348 stop:677 length:330 start_codon:yes stop_codon:yes gene_type:complete
MSFISANLKAITDAMLGGGQAWVDVKASRAINTIYTNNTLKPIFVSITLNASSGVYSTPNFYADGIIVGGSNGGDNRGGKTMTYPVKVGGTYQVTVSGSLTISKYVEFR